MKKISIVVIFLGIIIFSPLSAQALLQCGSNVGITGINNRVLDPACWTQTGGAYSCTVYGLGSGSYWACDGGHQTTDPSTGTNCFAYLETLKDTCGNYYGCSNRTDIHAGDVLDFNNTAYQCYGIESVTAWSPCVGGTQVATAVKWGQLSSSQNCVHAPTNQACCDTPTTYLDINGSTGPVNVTQENPFTINWSFANPGYEFMFTCNLKAPTPPGFVNDRLGTTTLKNLAGVVLPSPLSDTISILANFSNASTTYPYKLSCEPSTPSVACVGSSKTVNVTVTALPFTLDVTPNGGSEQIGTTIKWLATPHGGYPPYLYRWTGDVVNDYSPTKSFDRVYGFVGTKNVTVNARDNSGQNNSDSGSVDIVDTRIQQ